ncbi:ferredoxin reductase family protein [Patulibacter sp. NPDC049589]|uniref:ferredoxin reductase family protein n=1 Tax=Patulibacter sp. NPDC049589 TaxID=3154731 RepID=UPI0034496E75
MTTVQRTDLRRPPAGRRWPDALRLGPADLLGPIGIASVGVVVFMWLRTGGPDTTLAGVDTAIGSLGLLSGLLAADLMLLQVVMLARIPAVERAWGHDVLANRHRQVGYWSFSLMVTHVVLFAVDRGTRDGASWATNLLDLFVRNSWYLLATLGTVMLIGVVATSIRWARRRLRYESWHLLHLYTYLGMGLAMPHQLADGMHFHGPIARAYWWTIYGIAVVTVLTFRVALPVGRSLHHRIRVAEVTQEAPGVVSVHVSGHRLDRLSTRSGQFFVWRFLDGPGWTRGNPYSISAAPGGDRLRVTIQVVGDASARAARLRPGTRVAIEGPYGAMTARRRRHDRLLFVAAGVGVAPLRALLEDTPYAPGDATLVYRYADDEHRLFREELRELADRRGLELHLLPGPRAADGAWRPAGDDRDDVAALSRLVPDVADRDVFVCGPGPWTRAVRRAALAAGARPGRLHSEDFGW